MRLINASQENRFTGIMGAPAQKAAELDYIAHLFAHGRDQPDGCGLLVYHADGHLIGDDSGDRRTGSAAGNGDHVQPH